jgi:hypothetical protein
MLWWVTAAGATEWAVLQVGVHRDAGVLSSIAADGAAGLCVPGIAAISCPAEGPVAFRWAGASGWELVGDATVMPGDTGQAWVLAVDDPAVLAPLAELVRPTAYAAFVATGDHATPPLSPGLLERLWDAARSPDPLVRRVAVDGLVPLLRHTSSDPFPAEAPPLLPPGLIAGLGRDPDVRVRRRLAAILREVRPTEATPTWFTDEVRDTLARLVRDTAPVSRAAIASLGQSAWSGVVPARDAWADAMERVQLPGPPGRAAAATLARLAASLDAGPGIDPAAAVGLVFTHQREKTWLVWTAWRQDVPFDRPMLDVLLRSTLGVGTRLLRYWAEKEPAALAAAVEAWEPTAPHSDRFRIARDALVGTADPALRAALDLPPAAR